MIMLWSVLYGLVWVVWFICVVGALGNAKWMTLLQTSAGFHPSERYLRGLSLSQLDDMSANVNS
jgi:hypothetical protein